MAGKLPGFLNGANLILKVVGSDVGGDATGSFILAYANNLTFNHNMANAGVQVIGAMANQTLEPLVYSAGGNATIMTYTSASRGENGAKTVINGRAPKTQTASGNSFLHRSHLYPRRMLISKTFDIYVHVKSGTFPTNADAAAALKATTQNPTNEQIAAKLEELIANAIGDPIWIIYDCRLSDWQLNFTPGALATERFSFMARGVKHARLASEASKDEDLIGAANTI